MSATISGGSPESRQHRRSRGYRPTDSPEEAVRLKVEPDADIKDYAENTMNELLGWYGYEKLDARGINLKNFNHHPLTTSSSSSSPLRHEEEDFSDEDDTGLSRSPHTETEVSALNGTITCAWCLKTGLKLFTLKTSSGKTKAFCSEPCFNQCRRAAFKKNRVCNWCRHVRHTVNYVDFKDGDDQLQFCSDKCLNQYKMQIFCKETQAYLQMNPHLQQESSKQMGTPSSKLITPDLWLRDCQEIMNGRMVPKSPHSDEESMPHNINKTSAVVLKQDEDIEDLTLSSKPERYKSPGNSTHERESSNETLKSADSISTTKDKRVLDTYSDTNSYFKDDRERKTSERERKKRYHLENDKDSFRKRHRVSSMRSKSNNQPEAPPAHLSSTMHSHSTLGMLNQSRLFSHSISSYPSSSPAPVNPPIAHSKPLPHHPALTGPLLPPGLPPPPPLLNNDFLHPPFNSQYFQSSSPSQQHLDAVLRMQSLGKSSEHFPSQFFQEPMMPFLRNGPAPQHGSTPLIQPNTVMLPYPVFVPLPVPIPIPIPLANFLPKKQQTTEVKQEKDVEDLASGVTISELVKVDSDSDKSVKSKISKSYTKDPYLVKPTALEKSTDVDPSYAVINSDCHTNRLILTRNKTR